MALSRLSVAPCSGWEVDGSGLEVRQQRLGQWHISCIDLDYLERHQLLDQVFSTRARAVDAARMTLAHERMEREPHTRWKRLTQHGTGEWEVDGSWLIVHRQARGAGWVLSGLEAEGFGYLERHRLEKVTFSSRARAVEALRLALAEEPLTHPILTRWKREGEGVYLSTDGHWQLTREGKGARLSARSQQSREGLAVMRRQNSRSIEWLLEMLSPSTLRLCAQRADRLNRMIAAPGKLSAGSSRER